MKEKEVEKKKERKLELRVPSPRGDCQRLTVSLSSAGVTVFFGFSTTS